jgi:hypothetical protein
MSKQAFALKESVDRDTYGGGSVILAGKTFRLPKEQLARGESLVTGDPQEIAAYELVPELKGVPVPEKQAKGGRS